MINDIDGFIESIFQIKELDDNPGVKFPLPNGAGGLVTKYLVNLSSTQYGDMYCPRCCGERRMRVSLKYSPNITTRNMFVEPIISMEVDKCIEGIKNKLMLSLWTYKCTQCDTIFTVVFYQGANGTEIAILPSCNGGVVTANTPNSVAYYLDQAYRAKSVGANSACIAMYRGALDQLMYQQGYTEGMLGLKLKKLQQDIESGKAQKWAMDLDINLLSYLNALGSASIHPNDGDVEKQKELDNELIGVVDVVFGMLLDKIYEQPKRENDWKKALEEKSKSFSWKNLKK